MDENGKTDGTTAMERLCREMAEYVVERLPASWCQDHGIYDGEPWSQCRSIARADIERRINEADLEDDRARDSALGWYKAKAAELDALRGAGRVVPEGCRWPSFGDGGRLALGGEAWTKDGGRVRVVAVTHRGRAAVRPWGRKDGRGARWVPLSSLLGERPDSWERLREDAANSNELYWGCGDVWCSDCPARVGGKTPKERYRTNSCGLAMQLDLLARAERLAGVER